MNVLVTGATGAVGPSLVGLLIEKGYRVRVLMHKRAMPDILPGEVEVFPGDIRDVESLKPAVENVDFVFHLAGMLHRNDPDPFLARRYRAVNVDGTRNIVMVSRQNRVKRIVLFSTISVYGYSLPGEILDETSAVNPQTFYAQTKYEAETLALDYSADPLSEPFVTVLRIASVYGRRMTGNYLALIRAVDKGFFIFPGREDVFRTLIQERDVAEGAVLAAEHPCAAGKIYNLTDGSVHSLRSIVESIANALGQRCTTMNFPRRPLNGVLNFIDGHPPKAGGVISNFGVRLAKLMENMAVSGDKMGLELGFKPSYDMETGWHYALNKN